MHILLHPAPSERSCHIPHTVPLAMHTWLVVDSTVLHQYVKCSHEVLRYTKYPRFQASSDQPCQHPSIFSVAHQVYGVASQTVSFLECISSFVTPNLATKNLVLVKHAQSNSQTHSQTCAYINTHMYIHAHSHADAYT